MEHKKQTLKEYEDDLFSTLIAYEKKTMRRKCFRKIFKAVYIEGRIQGRKDNQK